MFLLIAASTGFGNLLEAAAFIDVLRLGRPVWVRKQLNTITRRCSLVHSNVPCLETSHRSSLELAASSPHLLMSAWLTLSDASRLRRLLKVPPAGFQEDRRSREPSRLQQHMHRLCNKTRLNGIAS